MVLSQYLRGMPARDVGPGISGSPGGIERFSQWASAVVILFIFLSLLPCMSFAEQLATTEDGRTVILRDDGTWGYSEGQPKKRSEPNEYVGANDMIRNHCKTEWPDDYRMRAHCEQQQKEAVEKLKAGKPKDIHQEEYAVVHKKCEAEWPENYRMRHYCEEQQFKGVRELKKR